MLSLHHAFHRPLSSEFRAFERLFSEPVGVGPRAQKATGPRSKVVTSDDAIHVIAEVPGLRADEIEINYHAGVLTLKSRFSESTAEGDKKSERDKGERVVFDEQVHKAFERRFRFANVVATDAIEAQLENGVLRVTLPKKEAAKPRQIAVKVG
jgi:HSP20 family protein